MADAYTERQEAIEAKLQALAGRLRSGGAERLEAPLSLNISAHGVLSMPGGLKGASQQPTASPSPFQDPRARDR